MSSPTSPPDTKLLQNSLRIFFVNLKQMCGSSKSWGTNDDCPAEEPRVSHEFLCEFSVRFFGPSVPADEGQNDTRKVLQNPRSYLSKKASQEPPCKKRGLKRRTFSRNCTGHL